ncbi:hypothetical protein CHS0354_042494 [Potamilus streckersoni]|uniref:Uncharacterized protein n=1 Tax=Potamilus streckersoni TaxID=2493646 RepID=A0AAE0S953_9BIVA|nr:hypothetical protein CHS0354_042494 [Potamilus streckersoni]
MSTCKLTDVSPNGLIRPIFSYAHGIRRQNSEPISTLLDEFRASSAGVVEEMQIEDIFVITKERLLNSLQAYVVGLSYHTLSLKVKMKNWKTLE